MRVAIADDAVLFRAGVASLLTGAGMSVIASVGSAEELLRAVERDPPDAAIVDIRMPPTHTTEGLEAAAQIAAANPDVGVLVLSQHVEAHYALRLLNERPRGAGYLLKDRVIDVDDFLSALRRVAAGGSAVDAEVISQILGRSRKRGELDRLTPREREVLTLMAEGLSNVGIAEQLVVSAGAVEKHISNVFMKLGLEPEDGAHRRVLAVLTYLRGS